MNSLLYQLYTGDYDTTLERDKRQRELDRKIYDEWEKVQKRFGDSFTDRLFELEGEREELREFLYFRKGFSLGIQLMLEALTSATA